MIGPDVIPRFRQDIHEFRPDFRYGFVDFLCRDQETAEAHAVKFFCQFPHGPVAFFLHSREDIFHTPADTGIFCLAPFGDVPYFLQRQPVIGHFYPFHVYLPL